MNTKLTKNLLQTISGVLALIILMCAGMFLYARWDLKRFKESIGEPSEVSPMTVSQTEKETNTHTEEATLAEIAVPKPLAQYHIADPQPEELEMETPSFETLDSLIDELSLSEVEILEEMITEENLEKDKVTQTDELQGEIASGGGFKRLISALESGNVDIGTGDPEDVATVVNILKRSTRGPIVVDDLITMMEAWLRIQPDTPHTQSMANENRDSTMKALLRLRALKEESLQSGKETKRILQIY